MPVKHFRPLTPSTRYITIADFSDITKTTPEKSLVVTRKKSGGRNHYGRVTARGIGGGHKQKIRLVDFKRNKHGVQATVSAIEYDPMRSARLALLDYTDGEKRYIIAPVGVPEPSRINDFNRCRAVQFNRAIRRALRRSTLLEEGTADLVGAMSRTAVRVRHPSWGRCQSGKRVSVLRQGDLAGARADAV